jgi:AcrR family transcriptional regulator
MNGAADTKSRILDVAEGLFAEQGVERVSIRDITIAAEVNLAAVNYHFGGKDELIEAVFERRIRPVNEARIEALRRLRPARPGKGPKVEEILEAFIRPTLTCCANDPKGGHAFARLFGRCLAEPRPEVETLLREQFEPLRKELEGALIKAVPHLSREEIFWRMKFTFGALHHWMLSRDRFLPPWAKETGVEEQTQELIAFAAAGLKAKSLVNV